MAGKLQTSADWEKFDEQRMRLAVEEIRASDNLRYFIRYVLADMQPLAHMGGDPAAIQMQAGSHNTAVGFIGTLDAFDPLLWLDIAREGVEESMTRLAQGDPDNV